jgi:hypothetical protein
MAEIERHVSHGSSTKEKGDIPCPQLGHRNFEFRHCEGRQAQSKYTRGVYTHLDTFEGPSRRYRHVAQKLPCATGPPTLLEQRCSPRDVGLSPVANGSVAASQGQAGPWLDSFMQVFIPWLGSAWELSSRSTAWLHMY